MTIPLGLPYTNSTPDSAEKKNLMGIPSDTGNNLITYDKTKFKVVACTEDSTGLEYLKDHLYLFGDGVVIDVNALVAHGHTGYTDGGWFGSVLLRNPEVLDKLFQGDVTFVKANWNQTNTGTATIEDGGGGSSEPYIRLRPNGTSGSGSTISYTMGKPRLNFDSPFEFISVIQFETATSLAAHIGVNADDVTAADSNTAKIQAEVCTATNTNWWLRNATGSANTASDTGVPITANNTHVVLFHDPWAGTPNDQIHVSGSTEAFMKTTNVATSSTSAATDNFMKFSIKNSVAADRPMKVKGARMIWRTDDTWGYSGYVEPQP